MGTQLATDVFTVNLTADCDRGIAIGLAHAPAGAGETIVGIADQNGISGENIRVVRGVSAIAISGAAIDGLESRLMTDAAGKLIPVAAGTDITAAYVIPGNLATAADQEIKVYVAPLRNS